MSRSVETTYEIEALGVTLDIEAEYSPGEAAVINIGQPELASPGSGPELEAMRIRLNGEEIDEDLLAEIYVPATRRDLVWDDDGRVILLALTGTPASFSPMVRVPQLVLPKMLNPRPGMCDAQGRQNVRYLVSLAESINEVVSGEISEHDADFEPDDGDNRD